MTIISDLSRRDAIERASQLTTQTAAQKLYGQALDGDDRILASAIEQAANDHGWELDTTARSRFAAEAAQARDAFRELADALADARPAMQSAETFTDQRLTADAQQTERTTRQQSVSVALAEKAQTTIDAITRYARRASTRAATARPRLDTTDAAQLTRTAQAWQFTVVPQLDAGRPWTDIIPTLDEDGLLAIERFAPSWFAANRNPFERDAELQVTLDGARARYVDVVTDLDARAALRTERVVNEILNEATNLATAVIQARNSTQLATAALVSVNAAHRLGVTDAR